VAGAGVAAGLAAGTAGGAGEALALPPGAPVVLLHCDGGSLTGGPDSAAWALPPGVSWIRVPCIGRVSEGDLLRALRGGAAAVLLSACAPGRCRFHEGDLRAEEAVARAQGVLARRGLDPHRVALLRPAGGGQPGRGAANGGFESAFLQEVSRICEELCPERLAERESAEAGWMRRAMPAGARWPHHGAVQEAALLSHRARPVRFPAPAWARPAPGPEPGPASDRGSGDRERSRESAQDLQDPQDLLYGCVLSDLDDLLGVEFGAEGVAPQRAALELLRATGLAPAVSDRMPACGHDFALVGDHGALSRVAGGLAEAVGRCGARRVITVCPECEVTLRRRYPRVGVTLESAGARKGAGAREGAGAFEVTGALDLLYGRRARLRFAEALPVPVAVFADVDEDEVEATERRQGRAADLLEAAGYEVVARLPDPYAEPGAQGSAGVEGFVACDAAARAAQDRLLSVAQEAGAARLLCTSALSAVHLGCALRRGGWRRHRLQVSTVYQALAERLAVSR
jgi:coenzyme F420-reducing hydrogenase delta subunit/uncharacterized protein YbbK (DUF523 family)